MLISAIGKDDTPFKLQTPGSVLSGLSSSSHCLFLVHQGLNLLSKLLGNCPLPTVLSLLFTIHYADDNDMTRLKFPP